MKEKNNKQKEEQKPAGNKKFLSVNFFFIAAIIAAVFFIARYHFIRIVKIHNGNFLVTRYPLKEENWDHPRLKLLRMRENLDAVIAPGKSEFDKIVLLRKWAHEQWGGGDNRFYYPPWDAVEILDLYRQHGNRAFCAQYAIVFLQACLAMGLPGRYVDLPGHFVTGIWSNEYQKWMIMDPTGDIHFEKEGIPMNGRELIESYWKKQIKGIVKVGSDGKRTPISMSDLKIYRMYSIVLRTNQLSQPETVFMNGVETKLVVQKDYTRYPFVGKEHFGFGEEFIAWREQDETEYFPGKPYTSDPEDFNDEVNQTIIEVASDDSEKGMIKLELRAENASTFETFQVRLNDVGEWKPSQKLVMWSLDPGMNKLSARILTRFGWKGEESSIRVFYKPRWFKRSSDKSENNPEPAETPQ